MLRIRIRTNWRILAVWCVAACVANAQSELGCPSVVPSGATVDAEGNLYVAGWTEGTLAQGGSLKGRALLAKFEPDGELAWIRRFGEIGGFAHDVDIDGEGNLYVTGQARPHNQDDPTAAPAFSAFLTKLDSHGDMLWSRPIELNVAQNGTLLRHLS